MALNAGDLQIAPLLPPPTSPSASPEWKSLRANSAAWIPITVPLRREKGELAISHTTDLRGGFDPELAISVLIRSQRRPSGGRTVTDFEVWVPPSVDATDYEVRTSANFVARVEPGVPLGLGHDGGEGTWNAAVEGPTNEALIQMRRDTAGDAPDIIFGPPFDT